MDYGIYNDNIISKPENVNVFDLVKRKANLPSLMLGAGSVLAGSGAAALRGNMDILPAILCLLFAIATQLAANLSHYYYMVNRYYDNMPRPKLHNPLTHGNLLAVRVLREASFACAIIAAMLGLVIMAMAETVWWPLLFAVIIVGSNLLLTRGKHPLFGSPWSLIFTWNTFGPIAVLGTCYLQVQHGAAVNWGWYDNAPSIFLAVAIGFLACNVHLIYSYSMNQLDPGCNPNSIVTKWGKRAAEWLIFFNGLIPFVIMFFGVFYIVVPKAHLALVPMFLAFALNTYIALRLHKAQIGEMMHLSMLAKLNYLLTGITTLIIWLYIGAPDVSTTVFF